jgi:hypothetical protein
MERYIGFIKRPFDETVNPHLKMLIFPSNFSPFLPFHFQSSRISKNKAVIETEMRCIFGYRVKTICFDPPGAFCMLWKYAISGGKYYRRNIAD